MEPDGTQFAANAETTSFVRHLKELPDHKQAFQRCFVAWVAALTNTPAEVIAIDGKTSRRSYQKKGSKIAAAARTAKRVDVNKRRPLGISISIV